MKILAFLHEEPTPLLDDNSKRVVQKVIEILDTADVAIAFLSGSIDIDSSPAVRDQLLAFLSGPQAKPVSIDLSRVTHMDSSGIATLIEALKIAQSCNREVKLQGLEGRLLHLFQATGILSLFNESTGASSHAGAEVV